MLSLGAKECRLHEKSQVTAGNGDMAGRRLSPFHLSAAVNETLMVSTLHAGGKEEHVNFESTLCGRPIRRTLLGEQTGRRKMRLRSRVWLVCVHACFRE